jgi:hypothetical protein
MPIPAHDTDSTLLPALAVSQKGVVGHKWSEQDYLPMRLGMARARYTKGDWQGSLEEYRSVGWGATLSIPHIYLPTPDGHTHA